MTTFSVTVARDHLVFASAHFITLRGHACESLHGHNYRAAVTIEGPIDPECHFVVDFAVLLRAARRMIETLDHHVLLAGDNAKLRIRTEGDATLVDYRDALTYRFPTRDCTVLPVANTTAELIAEWLAGGIRADLAREGVTVTRIMVEVEESVGMSASYQEDFS